MGDNLVLLTSREGEQMEDLVQLNKEWFESVFGVIDPWSESYLARHKIVWVRCYDLPLSRWNKDCFSKVVGKVASLVTIDKSMEWEVLEYARLAKGMRINGQIHNISIEEEDPRGNGGQFNFPYNHYVTSDSVSSSDSFVEETLFSEECLNLEDL